MNPNEVQKVKVEELKKIMKGNLSLLVVIFQVYGLLIVSIVFFSHYEVFKKDKWWIFSLPVISFVNGVVLVNTFIQKDCIL